MIDTSPPVHPTGVEHGFNNGVAGMTLLQYYAGQAMQGMLTTRSAGYEMDTRAMSVWSFSMAESMMKEYNKRYGGIND